MARDRLRLNKNHIEIIKQWRNENYLGLNDSETKDIFLLLAALGLDNPKELQSVDGYVLLSYIKTYEKSIMASILLGITSNNEQIDKVADAEVSYAWLSRVLILPGGVSCGRVRRERTEGALGSTLSNPSLCTWGISSESECGSSVPYAFRTRSVCCSCLFCRNFSCALDAAFPEALIILLPC